MGDLVDGKCRCGKRGSLHLGICAVCWSDDYTEEARLLTAAREQIAVLREALGRMRRGRGLTTAEIDGILENVEHTLASLKEETVRQFFDEVERRAERNMLLTGKLEGAHYAALKSLLKEKYGDE